MFGSGYDCLLLYSSDILWFVKQLWRQLLRSRERSCSSCKRKPPSGGGIGWEEFWQRSVESTCEKMSNAAGLPVRANSSSKWLPVSELREALLAYLAPEAEKAGIV